MIETVVTLRTVPRLTRDRPAYDWGEDWWQTSPTTYDQAQQWFRAGWDRAAMLAALDEAVMAGASAAEIAGYHYGYVDAERLMRIAAMGC